MLLYAVTFTLNCTKQLAVCQAAQAATATLPAHAPFKIQLDRKLSVHEHRTP